MEQNYELKFRFPSLRKFVGPFPPCPVFKKFATVEVLEQINKTWLGCEDNEGKGELVTLNNVKIPFHRKLSVQRNFF